MLIFCKRKKTPVETILKTIKKGVSGNSRDGKNVKNEIPKPVNPRLVQKFID
jgi:hypothetical protein